MEVDVLVGSPAIRCVALVTFCLGFGFAVRVSVAGRGGSGDRGKEPARWESAPAELIRVTDAKEGAPISGPSTTRAESGRAESPVTPDPERTWLFDPSFAPGAEDELVRSSGAVATRPLAMTNQEYTRLVRGGTADELLERSYQAVTRISSRNKSRSREGITALEKGHYLFAAYFNGDELTPIVARYFHTGARTRRHWRLMFQGPAKPTPRQQATIDQIIADLVRDQEIARRRIWVEVRRLVTPRRRVSLVVGSIAASGELVLAIVPAEADFALDALLREVSSLRLRSRQEVAECVR